MDLCFYVILPNPILTPPERREPAAGGPVSWVPFLCFLSLGKQRKEGVARGRNPGLNSPK